MKNSLQKLTLDTRDYSHDVFFGTLGASDLPTGDFTIYDKLAYIAQPFDTLSSLANKFCISMEELTQSNPHIKGPNAYGNIVNVPPRQNIILNQNELDFCPGFSAVELQNAIWGTNFDPYYQFAKIKQVRGEYTQYGANVRDSAKSVVRYGSLPAKLAPYTHGLNAVSDRDRNFLANWENYPTEFDGFASKYADESYFFLDGKYDAFDNMRSALWIHILERRGISFGLLWRESWSYTHGGIIPDTMPQPSPRDGGHDMAVVGQKTIDDKIYLVLQQTWGDGFGDKGFFYFPRTIIDQCFAQGYGAFLFSRIDKSGMTGSSIVGFFTQIFNAVVGLFKNI